MGEDRLSSSAQPTPMKSCSYLHSERLWRGSDSRVYCGLKPSRGLIGVICGFSPLMTNMELRGRCVLLAALVISAAHSARSGCENRVCNPRMGNLAVGRPVQTISQCGSASPEQYCHYSMDRCVERCEVCDASVTHLSHPPASMTDSPFKHPPTWWQSAQGVAVETLQLDLEVEFYFTHLIIIFRSPRPAAMTIERSQDFGQTWSFLRLYAHNCSEVFSLEDGHSCTQKYSTAWPCSSGEVIHRVLSPWDKLDPYSITSRAHLSITNIRVRLLQPQLCPCQHKLPDAHFTTAHYAIYDLLLKGGCLCHGHADQCVPAADQITHLPNKHMVHGKCVCRHHTAGDHCERCHRLYNDQPWQPASGLTGEAHQCVRCKCNGHAESCHFDETLWLRSGRRSGGVCDCLHNTSGRHCQHCKSGFYRDPERVLSHPDSCTPCLCNHVGSTSCNRDNGDCVCKPGVVGPHCDHCMLGYWGLDEYGCKRCQCAGDCEPHTGDCLIRSESDHSSNENDLFRTEELFSALTHPDKCVCKQQGLGNSKVFCKLKNAYAVKVRVLAAHDKGSHAEVDVQLMKVLWENIGIRLTRGNRTLYPESWTSRGCTCPVLYPGMEYLVVGHEDVRKGRLMINMKSLVQPWKPSLSRKVHQLLKTKCR